MQTMKCIFLSRIQPAFIKKAMEYLSEHDMTKKALAEKIGQHQSICNDLLNNKRGLSALYLLPYLQGGIMVASEIYDGKPETDRERRWWARQLLMENPRLVEAASRVEAAGGDPVAELEFRASLLESKTKKPR